ncbi:MAG: Cys-tRNA(Pro) deacylase [Desulfuromonadales bacterium]|nr:Cys-tRNA(Pro) deacylase [Desulfuromonadales bacterium]MDT8423109.1 Cys-tRNA(Pro) deacylase [Desulfuromonadales bacterium]
MAKDKIPSTPALRLLRQQRVNFIPRPYSYEAKGGTAVSARELGVAEHNVIKTLIMEDDARQPLIVLMHGDCEVSTKELARLIGVKSIRPCDPKTADRHSGYQVGGTSPFATRKNMPVYLEKTILELDRIYINGGKRGLLIEIDPRTLCELLQPELISVAIS